MTAVKSPLKQKFKLIEGNFSVADAQMVLMNVVSTKINFHSKEMFSNQERFGKDVLNSEKRISELKREEEKIKISLEEAKAKGLHLKIRCNITIEYFKNNH